LLIAILSFVFLLFVLWVLGGFIGSSLRGWISEKRMERRGFVRKLVYHEGECQWVRDSEEAMPDVVGDFRQKEVRRAQPKRLDKNSEQELGRPSKEELDRLKENLHLASGCLCFKHGAVYVVTCEGKKRRWRRLGRWETLREDIGK
jgi:hypothetical protein